MQFKEHGQPLKIHDMTKLSSIDEELGQKVAEIGEAISKAIHQDIINIYGLEPVLPNNVTKKSPLELILILLYV